eukprot:g13351.t1
MAFCEIESEFDFGTVGNDDCFPMNLMSNENVMWTVERERGISFDLTALTDPESRQPESGAFQDVIRREVKLEAESGVKESTFGHPFGGQCRPQPRPAPPSPFSRGGAGPPNKRMLPPSFELRDSTSAKRQQWEPSPAADDGAAQLHQPRALGRTRSRSVRPNPPKSAIAAAAAAAAEEEAAAAAAAAPAGRSKSGHSRGKTEAAEAGVAASSAPRRRYVGGVDTMALTAELGLVDRRRCTRRTKNGALYKVGAYTLEERAALVARFHAKRGRRIWRKKIKYDCRKKLADKRPRLKGRFVTQEELEGLDSETLAKVTGLGPWPEDASDVDAGEASDSSEGYTRPALTTSRYQGSNKRGRRQQASRSPRKSLCEKAAAAAAAAATAKTAKLKLASTEDEDEEEDDIDDGSSTSAASEESDKMSVSPGGEEGAGVRAEMERVSSSCKVSDLFAVKTEADVDITEQQQHQVDQDQQQTEEDDDDDDDDDSEIKIEDYEPTDPVFGFMVDDIMSNSFNVVPTGDVEGMSAGVAVN